MTLSLSLSIQNTSSILVTIQIIVGIHSCSVFMDIMVRILIEMNDRILDEMLLEMNEEVHLLFEDILETIQHILKPK